MDINTAMAILFGMLLLFEIAVIWLVFYYGDKDEDKF